MSLAIFLRVDSTSKEVSYLSWQGKYPNLKSNCHIKLKFFLRTKLLKKLLLEKYLISVAATLSRGYIVQFTPHFVCCSTLINVLWYTNAYLKTSLNVQVHIKTISWKFRIPNPKNSRVIYAWSLFFSYCFCMLVNKHFI